MAQTSKKADRNEYRVVAMATLAIAYLLLRFVICFACVTWNFHIVDVMVMSHLLFFDELRICIVLSIWPAKNSLLYSLLNCISYFTSCCELRNNVHVSYYSKTWSCLLSTHIHHTNELVVSDDYNRIYAVDIPSSHDIIGMKKQRF
mgnify:CR=1 FL=1